MLQLEALHRAAEKAKPRSKRVRVVKPWQSYGSEVCGGGEGEGQARWRGEGGDVGRGEGEEYDGKATEGGFAGWGGPSCLWRSA